MQNFNVTAVHNIIRLQGGIIMSKRVQIVSNNGRVTIPAELQVADYLQTGDRVIFRTDEQGQIVIEKAADRPE